jgi:hypothetical protein
MRDLTPGIRGIDCATIQFCSNQVGATRLTTPPGATSQTGPAPVGTSQATATCLTKPTRCDKPYPPGPLLCDIPRRTEPDQCDVPRLFLSVRLALPCQFETMRQAIPRHVRSYLGRATCRLMPVRSTATILVSPRQHRATCHATSFRCDLPFLAGTLRCDKTSHLRSARLDATDRALSAPASTVRQSKPNRALPLPTRRFP